MKNAPDDDRVQRARQARQVISGSDLRPPAPAAYSPRSAPVSPAGEALLNDSQRNYLIAVGVLLALGLIVYVVFSFGIASIVFFLLAMALLAGWVVF